MTDPTYRFTGTTGVHVCETCSVRVLDTTAHTFWHNRLDARPPHTAAAAGAEDEA